MDERTLRAVVAAGAVSRIRIIANGARFHVEIGTPNGTMTAETRKGRLRTWATLDATARWVRGLGVGNVAVDMTHWRPQQKELRMNPTDGCDGRRQSELLI